MATRFYHKSESPPITPTWNQLSCWDQNTGGRVYWNTECAIAYTEPGASETSTTTNWDVGISQIVFPQLGAQTINGTVSMQIMYVETSGNANDYGSICFYLVDSSGTYKSTILAYTVDDVEVDARGWVNRTLLNGVSITQQTSINGDYLVAEIGYRAVNTKDTSYTGGIFMISGEATDLPVDDTDTDYTNKNPWIEFSHDFVWYSAPSVWVPKVIFIG